MSPARPASSAAPEREANLIWKTGSWRRTMCRRTGRWRTPCARRRFPNTSARKRPRKTWPCSSRRRASARRAWTMCCSTARPASGRRRWPASIANELGVNLRVTFRPGDREAGRPGGAAHEPRPGRRALHRRDPPPLAQRGGDPLPCHGGLRDRHHHRQGSDGGPLITCRCRTSRSWAPRRAPGRSPPRCATASAWCSAWSSTRRRSWPAS